MGLSPTVVKLISGLCVLFILLAIGAFVYHDPSDKWKDPYDDGDVSRDHAARHKLADGSCLEMVGPHHMLDYRLGECLAKHLKGWKVLRSIKMTPLKTMQEFRSHVTKLRAEGVREFPIVMDKEMATGLIVIVGCLPPRSYLGGLDDLLNLVGSIGPETFTRESLWKACKRNS